MINIGQSCPKKETSRTAMSHSASPPPPPSPPSPPSYRTKASIAVRWYLLLFRFESGVSLITATPPVFIYGGGAVGRWGGGGSGGGFAASGHL